MRNLSKIFFKGLMAIIPLLLTGYIIYWLASTAESVLGNVIKLVLPGNLYIPGMGVVAGVLVIIAVGFLLQVWLFRKIFDYCEKILEKVPLIKSLYGSIRDLMSFFDSSKKKDFDKVVMVKPVDSDTRLIGFVTREDFKDLPDEISRDKTVAVYMPMSYQMGGFTIFVPKENIEPVDLSIEEAMRFAFTAAVSTKKKGQEQKDSNEKDE